MKDNKQIAEIALSMLSGFKGCIEIEDFQRFLLVNFSSKEGPMSVMSMLGMGERPSITLSYDPLRSVYFYKILGGNQEMSQVYLYSRQDPLLKENEFQSKEPAALLKDKLSPKEIELLGIGLKKRKLLHVNSSDFYLLDSMVNGKKTKIEIDMVFSDLEGFIVGYDEKSRVFLLEGEEGDLLFNVNFSPLTRHDEMNLITFDIYLDEKGEIKKHKYISMNEDLEITLCDDVKEKNLQTTLYCLVVPVKSFDMP